MIFYPETGPQCPALPAGQACSINIGVVKIWLKPILRILSISWPSNQAYFYLIGVPIRQAAGLNTGNGMVVASEGLLDSNFFASSGFLSF